MWRQWRYLPSYLALIGIIISFGNILWLDSNPKILLPTANSSAVLRDSEHYRQAVQQYIQKSLVNRSKITIDTLALSQNLRTRFPEVKDVTVTMPLLGRRPIIHITPALPSVLLSTPSGLYVLDNKGRAILTAAQAVSPAAAELPLVVDESAADITIGKGVLPVQTVTFIEVVLAQLKAKQLPVESVTLPTAAEELHIKLKDHTYFVKLNTTSDPKQAIGTFLAVKSHLETDKKTPNEYIDVRVEERAYYR